MAPQVLCFTSPPEAHLPLAVHHWGPPSPAGWSGKAVGLTFPAFSGSRQGGERERERIPAQPTTGWLPEEAKKDRPTTLPDWHAAGKRGPWWHAAEEEWTSEARGEVKFSTSGAAVDSA